MYLDLFLDQKEWLFPQIIHPKELQALLLNASFLCLIFRRKHRPRRNWGQTHLMSQVYCNVNMLIIMCGCKDHRKCIQKQMQIGKDILLPVTDRVSFSNNISVLFFIIVQATKHFHSHTNCSRMSWMGNESHFWSNNWRIQKLDTYNVGIFVSLQYLWFTKMSSKCNWKEYLTNAKLGIKCFRSGYRVTTVVLVRDPWIWFIAKSRPPIFQLKCFSIFLSSSTSITSLCGSSSYSVGFLEVNLDPLSNPRCNGLFRTPCSSKVVFS